MKNDWIILRIHELEDKNADECNKLVDIMNQIEDGRGWRFTDEQAETLAKLVDRLFNQIRSCTKRANESRRKFTFPFLK